MNMRIAWIVAVVLTVLAAPAAAQPGKVFRVGMLSVATDSARPVLARALGELGYAEGGNLVIDSRCCAPGNPDLIKEFARDLIGAKVDVIVVTSPLAAHAAQAATTTIPIVFVAVANPVEIGLVKSLAKPGGNITGLAHAAGAPGDLLTKHIQLIKETVPSAKRIGVLINPTNPSFRRLNNIHAVAAAAGDRVGATIEVLEASTLADVASVLSGAPPRRLDALVVTGDPLFYAERVPLAEIVSRARIPTIYWYREHAEAGGLMAYSTDLRELVRRGARYIARIFGGENPGNIPVEQAAVFALTVNMKTARALGLTIPPAIIVRADQVIE
jgi:putative tryptophan/tyrosine transport system substrate-binding protein